MSDLLRRNLRKPPEPPLRPWSVSPLARTPVGEGKLRFQAFCRFTPCWLVSSILKGDDVRVRQSKKYEGTVILQNITTYQSGSQYSSLLQAGKWRVSTPVRTRFSTPVQTGHEAHPASCTKGTGVSLPAVKQSEKINTRWIYISSRKLDIFNNLKC
jgi:hypothetical protein